MNKSSSPLLAVFQIKVSSGQGRLTRPVPRIGKVEMKATFGKLTVVDLMSSERIKRAGSLARSSRRPRTSTPASSPSGTSSRHWPRRRNSSRARTRSSPGSGGFRRRQLQDEPAGVLLALRESSDETVSTLEFASRAARIAEITTMINEGVVVVDAASLVADVASLGRLDAAS